MCVAKATVPWRAYHRKDDAGWGTVLGPEADRCEGAWLASEPQRSSTRAVRRVRAGC